MLYHPTEVHGQPKGPRMGNTRPSHGLVDKVHMSFRLLPETLYLALSTMDRFLSARVLGQVTVAWHHLHVSHCQGRGDRGTIFLYCADLLTSCCI